MSGGKTSYMFGRKKIKTSVREIDSTNVVAVLKKALETHTTNRSEIDFLYKYYKGDQPIIYRVKKVRPEINNKIVVNRAYEIVSFKTGFLCGEPIQYVSATADDAVSKAVAMLNKYMFSEGKIAKDKELVEWQMICGTSYRLILPDETGDADEAPFEIYTLDPRDAFVVYSSGYKRTPLMAVICGKDEEDKDIYDIYTKNEYFLVRDKEVVEHSAHSLERIPIIEYPANNALLGAFEIVLSLLDAINMAASNRMDGVEQIIQAFIKFINCDITEEKFKEFKDLGAIKVKSMDGQKADVDVVKTDLNQDQVQTMTNSLYSDVLTICGMPNRNGGSSTSDTGSAVVMRDGWEAAETRAKDSETMFKSSEAEMLKLVLKICGGLREGMDLKLSDIEVKFTRRNYEAIQSKSQVLISMLNNEKIHPLLAFEHSGMFSDPESAYLLSMKHYAEQVRKWEQMSEEDIEDEEKTNVRDNGQVPEGTEGQS